MRKKIVAGNWKMNKSLSEGVELAKTVNRQVEENDITVVLCTPFIHLTEVNKIITKDSLYLGAQIVLLKLRELIPVKYLHK